MAYEIINNAQINPQRLYALLRVVIANPGIEEDKIYSLLQPKPLNNNQKAAEVLLDSAVKTELIYGDIHKRYKSKILSEEIETYAMFRALMQKRLLGVVDDNSDNYLLNLFIAWCAVKNAEILSKSSSLSDMAVDFNKTLFPESEIRALNTTKLGGIDDWMIFLGHGWKLNNYFLMPDASIRLESLLADLLPSPEEIPLAEFMNKLSDQCPELDRGILFEKCWQAVYGNKPHSNQLSLMLSTGLRSLQKKQKIRLIYLPDARDTWMLYPDMFDPRVTHIASVRKTV